MLVLAGQIDSLRGALACVFQAASKQIGLAEAGDHGRQTPRSAPGDLLLHPLFYQRQTRGDTPIQDIRQAQGCGLFGQEDRNGPVLAQTHRPLQHRDGSLHVSLAQIHHADPIARLNHGEGIIDGLGEPEPFFGQGESLRERTELRETIAQPGPGGRCDAAIATKALIEQLPVESRHIPLKTPNCPRIVSHVIIGHTQVDMRPGLQADMPERGGQGQGALTVVDGAIYLARCPAIDVHVGVDPPEPQVVAQRLGQSLSAAQVVEYPPPSFCQGSEYSA